MPASAPTRTGDSMATLETPCALLDEARMLRNIQRMQKRMDALGVALRPHVKTSKCLQVGALQRAAGGHGITVSTLKEAEQFFDGGFDDIFYAVALAPGKAQRALALQARGCKLRLLVDSMAAADALLEAAAIAGQRPSVLIEIDVDGRRAGVEPDAPMLVEIGKRLHEGGAQLLGLMSHAGASYDCNTPIALQHIAEQERALSVEAAEQLRWADLPCPVVSVGSTPTALSASRLDGVTEVRAGVYVFFDLVMAGTGVCSLDEIALSVLTTVIGHQPERGWVLVDAGWMALSRDRGTREQVLDRGYGVVCDEQGRVLDGWIVSGTNQEHGIVSCIQSDGADVRQRMPVGSRLRILPNHACATAAQHGAYHLVDGAHAGEVWTRFGGW